MDHARESPVLQQMRALLTVCTIAATSVILAIFTVLGGLFLIGDVLLKPVRKYTTAVEPFRMFS